MLRIFGRAGDFFGSLQKSCDIYMSAFASSGFHVRPVPETSLSRHMTLTARFDSYFHGAKMAQPIDRRSFLKSAAGGTVAIASLPALGVSSEASTGPSCKFFPASQAALVAALAEQIVPADEYPGARSAGVVFYIDGILAGRYGRFYVHQYQQGLKLVDEISQKQFDHTFVSLSMEQQTSVLRGMESGAAGEEARKFFLRILQHTMEGYYGDPGHGGNREKASWKMLGFEG